MCCVSHTSSLLFFLLEGNEWSHEKKASIEVEKLGKKIDINGDLEEERLSRAQAEEKHLGKSFVPRLVEGCFIALRLLFQVTVNSPVRLLLVPSLGCS